MQIRTIMTPYVTLKRCEVCAEVSHGMCLKKCKVSNKYK